MRAAETLLVEGGIEAVRVRSVAERVGLTDAGVNHHFGNRDALLIALLQHGGRRIRGVVEDAVACWLDDGAAIASLIEGVDRLYRNGYADLAAALHGAGWRDSGSGLLVPVVGALQHARRRSGQADPDIAQTQIAVAALHQALATDPLYGIEFRRSVGLSATAAKNTKPTLDWWATTVAAALGLDGSAVEEA